MLPKLDRLIISRKMPNGKFNPAVGKLAPLFNSWLEAALGGLIDDFAGFAASFFKGQRK